MVIKLEGWGPENNVMINIPCTYNIVWVSMLSVNSWVWWHRCTLGMQCPVVMMWSIVWAWHGVTYLTPQDMSCTVSPSPLSHAAPTWTEWKPVILCHWTNISRFHHPDTNDSKTEINLLVSYSALASWHHEASNCAWSPYQELSYCAVSPTYLTPHTSHQISRIFPSIRLNFYGRILVIHENPNTRNTQWSFPPSGRQ